MEQETEETSQKFASRVQQTIASELQLQRSEVTQADVDQWLAGITQDDSHILLREKTLLNWGKIRFLWRKLSQIASWCRQKMPCPQISQRKLSQIAKLFSLNSFPLFGTMTAVC